MGCRHCISVTRTIGKIQTLHYLLFYLLFNYVKNSFTIKSHILYIILLWPSGDLKTHAHLTDTKIL